MKEYTITKTLFKMKKHILPSESREGENYMKESLGTDLSDGPNGFCKRFGH